MRFLRYLTAVAFLACMALPASAKMVDKVYVFGLAASFNDSLVYITDIFEVDSAYIEDNRTHFLLNRGDYSYQLCNYFRQKGLGDRTCVTYWAMDAKSIEKQYAKVKKLYTEKSKDRYNVQFLTAKDFRYTAVKPAEAQEDAQPAKKEKKDRGRKPEGKRNGNTTPSHGEHPEGGMNGEPR